MAYYTPHGGYASTSAAHGGQEEEEEDEDYDPTLASNAKKGNAIPIYGNAASLNLNPLIVTNIQGSPYFKVNLFGLKTYHEVIDEIYYKVDHLEPWERGSRVRQFFLHCV